MNQPHLNLAADWKITVSIFHHLERHDAVIHNTLFGSEALKKLDFTSRMDATWQQLPRASYQQLDSEYDKEPAASIRRLGEPYPIGSSLYNSNRA